MIPRTRTAPLLALFDSRSQSIKAVRRQHTSCVRILICGPTVYDYMHVGHARMLLVYDLISRYLRFCGQQVFPLVTVTDIDQKIFDSAKKQGISPKAIASRFIAEMMIDVAALGITDFAFAKASKYVDVARPLIKRLLSGKIAYSSGGNVYLDSNRLTGFGSLSGMKFADLSDCRLDISESKRSPSDILVWNASERFGLEFQDAEVGSGIPWWHMQDTSIAMANFGGKYDIHGGADELVYPHHESHKAQTSALTGDSEPVGHWTHVGLITAAKGEKMSKSLGNSVKLRDALEQSGANAFRLYCYSTNYLQSSGYRMPDLATFERKDSNIRQVLQELHQSHHDSKLLDSFLSRIADNLDTPGALAVLEKAMSASDPGLWMMAKILGLRY